MRITQRVNTNLSRIQFTDPKERFIADPDKINEVSLARLETGEVAYTASFARRLAVVAFTVCAISTSAVASIMLEMWCNDEDVSRLNTGRLFK
jgi:hypothetical protein